MKNLDCLFVIIMCIKVAFVNGKVSNATCSCYMPGTMTSIEGESMCDNKTLQCKCYPNVIGKKCDKCAKGFYDIMTGNGCTSCRCNTLGSNSKSCNNLTGQCSCKEGFMGLRCDQCESYTYRFSAERCLKCNCNINGSNDLQCNIVGQCSCLPNVRGKHCDRCKENTFSIDKGCIPCPPCYEFVQNEIQNLTKYLNRMEEIIESIDNNLPLYIQDYKHFLNELKLLKAKIDKLKSQCKETTVSEISEETLNELNKRAEELHNEITGLIQRFNEEFEYDDISGTLYIGGQNLKESNNLVNTCEEALTNASELSSSLNRRNKTMSRLAEKALALTKDIEDQAEGYYLLSLEVAMCYNETCSAAEVFNKSQQAYRDEIEMISSELVNSSSGARTIKTYLTSFQKETKSSLEEAIQLKKQAEKLHISDTNGIMKNLKEIEDDSGKINVALQNVEKTLNENQEKQKATEEYLSEVKNKQDSIDSQRLLLIEYESRADKAINDTNSILEAAFESLKNLKEYEKLKHLAESALKDMSKIRADVDAVLNNSAEINHLFQELINTVDDINRIKTKITTLLESVEGNATKLLDNLKTLEELEEEQKKVSKDLMEHHQRLKNVKNGLDRLKQVQNDLERYIAGMDELIIVLNTIPITDYQLAEAKEEIETMEYMFATIEYLTAEKEKLEKEMENVKAILESLPINDTLLCETAKSEPKLLGS